MKIILLFLSMLLVNCTSIKNATRPSHNLSIRTTAYTHTESDHKRFRNKTAIGTTLKKKQSIAADWSIFPVGTVLKISGHNYTVDDYGCYIIDAAKKPIPTIDIYQPSMRDMNNWGVRFFDNVKVIQWGSWEQSLAYLKPVLYAPHCRMMYNQILAKM